MNRPIGSELFVLRITIKSVLQIAAAAHFPQPDAQSDRDYLPHKGELSNSLKFCQTEKGLEA